MQIPISKRFENVDSVPVPMDEGIDIPNDFDPGYVLQEICDCGNDRWEPGKIKLGSSTITGEVFEMNTTLCTLCKAPQLWLSKQYLKTRNLNGKS